MVDIDNFKKVNDNYGHASGDKVLKYVSKIVLKNVRSSDFIGRFGGEEFVIIMHNVTVKKAKRILERIRREIAECNLVYISKNSKISCRISAGIDEIRRNDILENVLDRVDKKLYKAKLLGKNRVIS